MDTKHTYIYTHRQKLLVKDTYQEISNNTSTCTKKFSRYTITL